LLFSTLSVQNSEGKEHDFLCLMVHMVTFKQTQQVVISKQTESLAGKGSAAFYTLSLQHM
ncbi:MAG: hypothetical protein IJV21_04445, partial [Lachnospiraceae bacterium]|nr:hypothetical protein [Lachnospiraceae bacterium]